MSPTAMQTNTVSVIAAATNTVIGSPIPVGSAPFGVAVTPDGSKVYVTNLFGNTVSVIATATNTVIGSPIPVGANPFGVAVTPDGSRVYVTNAVDNTVSVIATATNTVIGSPIPVGGFPVGVAVTPDGSKVYVANIGIVPTDMFPHRVGDRHGDQHGDRLPDPRRRLPPRRGGHPGRQQGLCHQRDDGDPNTLFSCR